MVLRRRKGGSLRRLPPISRLERRIYLGAQKDEDFEALIVNRWQVRHVQLQLETARLGGAANEFGAA
jgi:hypothetical protein